MYITFDDLLMIAYLLLYMDVTLLLLIIISKMHREDLKEVINEKRTSFMQFFFHKDIADEKSFSFNHYCDISQTLHLEKKHSQKLLKHVQKEHIDKKYIRQIRSRFKAKRMEAAVALAMIGTDSARTVLENALAIEKYNSVKLYIVNALSEIGDPRSLPYLISSLMSSKRWYRLKANSLICTFGEGFSVHLPNLMKRKDLEIKELLVEYASHYVSFSLKNYLQDLVDQRYKDLEDLNNIFIGNFNFCSNCIFGREKVADGKRLCRFKGPVAPDYLCKRYQKIPVSYNYQDNYLELIYKAAAILGEKYPSTLNQDVYLRSDDIRIRNIAVRSLANLHTEGNLERLFDSIKDDSVARTAVFSISTIIERQPHLTPLVVQRFIKEKDVHIKSRYADILSVRVEYFIMKLTGPHKANASSIISQVIALGKTSTIIGFLNRNTNVDIENELLAIVKRIVPTSSALEKEFCTYLESRLLLKIGLVQCDDILSKSSPQKDTKVIEILRTLLISAVFFFPILYIVRHHSILLTTPFIKHLKLFIIDFNYYLAVYSILINAVYLIILGFSFWGARKSVQIWQNKKNSLLFKKGILPSISVIAPAYNEEKTIIESVHSLLNLKYPDYELIIVNDGSKDHTLHQLVNYFELTRVDFLYDQKLQTMPVRGIYINRSLPKLIVVDKHNGGKADSLNAGINISKKEYFCGIDSDSLLEQDALLKLASITLDEERETPALGGNILPINGCNVSKGTINKLKIPRNRISRLQAVEYIRAFMAGRIGWSMLNTLQIISGAFGLFRKERVIDVGGYLTSLEKYGRDTVGEDMELVVRIGRLMREKGLPYSIRYSPLANCWTEVPEDYISLKKQRTRWHRGLTEIISFHRSTILNPRYGRMGMLAMPYFTIFELFGPLVEVLGYLMVILAIIMGLFNLEMALLLFVSIILLGILVSFSSMLLMIRSLNLYSFKDVFILILYAFLENFGPRQLISIWRVQSYFKILNKHEEWGHPTRKGFSVYHHVGGEGKNA